MEFITSSVESLSVLSTRLARLWVCVVFGNRNKTCEFFSPTMHYAKRDTRFCNSHFVTKKSHFMRMMRKRRPLNYLFNFSRDFKGFVSFFSLLSSFEPLSTMV